MLSQTFRLLQILLLLAMVLFLAACSDSIVTMNRVQQAVVVAL